MRSPFLVNTVVFGPFWPFFSLELFLVIFGRFGLQRRFWVNFGRFLGPFFWSFLAVLVFTVGFGHFWPFWSLAAFLVNFGRFLGPFFGHFSAFYFGPLVLWHFGRFLGLFLVNFGRFWPLAPFLGPCLVTFWAPCLVTFWSFFGPFFRSILAVFGL